MLTRPHRCSNFSRVINNFFTNLLAVRHLLKPSCESFQLKERQMGQFKIKWPICTTLILALFVGLGYWSYTMFTADKMTISKDKSGSSVGFPPIADRVPAHDPNFSSAKAPIRPNYRGQLPGYFLVGFAFLMTVILGTILYLWWSLRELEGGKRYGEGGRKNDPQISEMEKKI